MSEPEGPVRRARWRALVAAGGVGVLAIAMAPPDLGGVAAPDVVAAGCVAGELSDALAALVAPDAELLQVDDAGALALEPVLYPGMRHRLLPTPDGWCSAAAINVVQAATTDPVQQAAGAARVLAAANFDGVTVTDARLVDADTVALTTHARTNGVVADWTIDLDALGVVAATWTATGFGVAPFEAETEGFTALPGATVSYARDATGLVRTTTPAMADPLRFATGGDDEPSATIVDVMDDGFTIYVNLGDYGYFAPVSGAVGVAPDAGQDTGDSQLDYLRIMSAAAVENYNDFLGWGLSQEAGTGAASPGWNEDEGTIHVDGPFAAYCLACVFISEDFNVHMSRALHEALEVLGYSYPDERLAIVNVVGHEILHNWQNAYGRPDSVGGGRARAYSEGTARFSESLHGYSGVSNQPGSLIYADDSNGCNGYPTTDAGFAAGPLDGQGYQACHFWFAHYAEHGLAAQVEILERTAGLPSGSEYQVYADAIEAGTGVPMVDVLANYGAKALDEGPDHVWGDPNDVDGPTWDWLEPGLERWFPSATLGETFSATLGRGGIAAARVKADFTVTGIEGGAVALARGGDHVLLQVGDTVEAQRGDHVLLVNPTATTGTTVTLTVS